MVTLGNLPDDKMTDFMGFTAEEMQVIQFLSDGKEHFDEPEDIEDYYDICDELIEQKLVKEPLTKDDGYKLTAKGKTVWSLYIKSLLDNTESNGMIKPKEVKESGFCIAQDRISDVIKIIKSMYDVGLFVDQNGNKPTLKSVMDAFGKFLKANQFLQYSTYLNKALQAKENTFMEIFDQMEKIAEKYYKETKDRKISK